MKADLIAPARLVDLKRAAGLGREIRETAGGLSIGALATLADLETSPLVGHRYPALADAARLAATPQLRNVATLGGNLLQRPRCWYFRQRLFHCWLQGGDACPARNGENRLHALFGDSPCVAVHPSDLATALVALDANARLRGPSGERVLALREFFALPTDDRRVETRLRSDELIVEVTVPNSPPGARSVYLKAMDRKVWAFALVGVAAAIRLEAGRVADARLVLGGVAPIPWRREEAERVLVGETPDGDTFSRAAEAALVDAQPLRENGYKVPLARALIRRALAEAAARAG
jgi:xanthine dehydrogenase YagS FAD-binding subunit